MTSDLHHPLSRRTLTRRGLMAATAGAAALGALTTAPASAEGPLPGRGVRWKDGRVFPSFSGAGKITVADLRELDGFDRLLLITLQGLVNRDRPEVYVILDDVDETWLPDLPVRARRLEDPFARTA